MGKSSNKNHKKVPLHEVDGLNNYEDDIPPSDFRKKKKKKKKNSIPKDKKQKHFTEMTDEEKSAWKKSFSVSFKKQRE